jgi:hypothetical protein
MKASSSGFHSPGSPRFLPLDNQQGVQGRESSADRRIKIHALRIDVDFANLAFDFFAAYRSIPGNQVDDIQRVERGIHVDIDDVVNWWNVVPTHVEIDAGNRADQNSCSIRGRAADAAFGPFLIGQRKSNLILIDDRGLKIGSVKMPGSAKSLIA